MVQATRPALLAALLFSASVGCWSQPTAPMPTPAPATTDQPTGTVTVEVTSPGGSESFTIENVSSGTTVEEAMRSMQQIPVTIRGSGVTAFVESIGEVSTSQTEGWTYTVDGEFANVGIGSMELEPPTTITWSFGGAEVFDDPN